jgi:hypothetical protein
MYIVYGNIVFDKDAQDLIDRNNAKELTEDQLRVHRYAALQLNRIALRAETLYQAAWPETDGEPEEVFNAVLGVHNRITS